GCAREGEGLKARLKRLAEGGENLQAVMRYLDERIKDLNRLLHEIIQQEQRKRGVEPSDYAQRSSFADKSFSFYTDDDIRRMNEAVARLAQRLKIACPCDAKKLPAVGSTLRLRSEEICSTVACPFTSTWTGAEKPSRKS